MFVNYQKAFSKFVHSVRPVRESSRNFTSVVHKPLRISLVGAPGAGKGTQAESLQRDYGLSPISTGNLLRHEVNQKSEIGKQIEGILGKGGLVNDDIMLGLIENVLNKHSKDGWILDGYPRTLKQADDLDKLLTKIHQPIDIVFFLKVSEDVLWERVKDRWVHLPSGRMYNTVYSPPKNPGVDDVTGEPLVQRSDDTLETIRKRLDQFYKNTSPIIDYYEQKKLLITVDSPTSKVGYVKIKEVMDNYIKNKN